jgi:hypothetical protein
MTALDGALILWFVMTALSVVFAAYDLAMRTPAMRVMKWGWILVILYTGPLGLFVYLLSCREPLAGTHAEYVAPLWKQAVGSTIHCVAGDATGIIVGALIGVTLHVSPVLDLVIEYAAGFAFGLFIFQALFMKLMTGGSYFKAVGQTVVPEWLSMNALMAGMIPVMVIAMAGDMTAMEPAGMRFWGVMSMAILVGSVTAYPVNVWLVARGLKHGMGTVEVLGRGGHRMEMETAKRDKQVRSGTPGAESTHGHAPLGREKPGNGELLFVTIITVTVLALGVAIAVHLGDLSFSVHS